MIKKILLFFVALALMLYLIAVISLYHNQTKLMYFPSAQTPNNWLTLRSPRDNSVLGYQLPTNHVKGEKSALTKTVILFHGNAGSAAHRAYYQNIFSGNNTNIFIAEYPGFGANIKESISKEAVLARARLFVEAVQKNYPNNVVIAGESLGTGIAAHMALEYHAPKLMLFTPYSSIAEVAGYRYPWVPVGLLLKDNFNTLDSVASYKGESLVVLSEKDKTIPPQFGQKVYDALPQNHRALVFASEATHSSWWAHMNSKQKEVFSQFLNS